MAKPPSTLAHPVFGELRWDVKYSWWYTQVRLASGEWMDVFVDPGEGDPISFLEPGAKLYRKAMKAERRILRDAIRIELLELYNDTWRIGADPALTAKELMTRLQLKLVEIDTIVPVTLSYGAGDLFGSHSVALLVDEELNYEDTDLRG